MKRVHLGTALALISWAAVPHAAESAGTAPTRIATPILSAKGGAEPSNGSDRVRVTTTALVAIGQGSGAANETAVVVKAAALSAKGGM